MTSQFLSGPVAAQYMHEHARQDVLVINESRLSDETLRALGQWSRTAYWKRTVMDSAPRLSEDLSRAEVCHEAVSWPHRGSPLGFGGYRLVKADAEHVTIESMSRSVGGGSPSHPARFEYGPYTADGGIRLTLAEAEKLLTVVAGRECPANGKTHFHDFYAEMDGRR